MALIKTLSTTSQHRSIAPQDTQDIMQIQQDAIAQMRAADAHVHGSIIRNAPSCVQILTGGCIGQQWSNWAPEEDFYKDLHVLERDDPSRAAHAKVSWELHRSWVGPSHFGRTPSVTTSMMKASGHSEDHKVRSLVHSVSN
jgi:hypothetical protein